MDDGSSADNTIYNNIRSTTTYNIVHDTKRQSTHSLFEPQSIASSFISTAGGSLSSPLASPQSRRQSRSLGRLSAAESSSSEASSLFSPFSFIYPSILTIPPSPPLYPYSTQSPPSPDSLPSHLSPPIPSIPPALLASYPTQQRLMNVYPEVLAAHGELRGVPIVARNNYAERTVASSTFVVDGQENKACDVIIDSTYGNLDIVEGIDKDSESDKVDHSGGDMENQQSEEDNIRKSMEKGISAFKEQESMSEIHVIEKLRSGQISKTDKRSSIQGNKPRDRTVYSSRPTSINDNIRSKPTSVDPEKVSQSIHEKHLFSSMFQRRDDIIVNTKDIKTIRESWEIVSKTEREGVFTKRKPTEGDRIPGKLSGWSQPWLDESGKPTSKLWSVAFITLILVVMVLLTVGVAVGFGN
ncbi:10442_t:CDS:2 [Paraglomus occultum]|uniref:10442_t:CDS:1 n=1 Tax=Paraglomus occultum TaxID=144539 RepID=A0A9N9B2D4_9GLOM|nr:10442_t:CDS:2 [Paraglomus occultum]